MNLMHIICKHDPCTYGDKCKFKHITNASQASKADVEWAKARSGTSPRKPRANSPAAGARSTSRGSSRGSKGKRKSSKGK